MVLVIGLIASIVMLAATSHHLPESQPKQSINTINDVAFVHAVHQDARVVKDASTEQVTADGSTEADSDFDFEEKCLQHKISSLEDDLIAESL